MLTKKLFFDVPVLNVLRNYMTWEFDGKLGKITTQLDRKLYTDTNKALEALGGRWNRKAGGHVFENDPRPAIAEILGSGTLTVARDGFFETPLQVIERMWTYVAGLEYFHVLEPSAGLGAICDFLVERGISKDRIDCVEINQERCDTLASKGYKVVCTDFLTYNPPPVYDLIMMNPPFENCQDVDHILHAFSFLAHGGFLVSVASEGINFRSDRKTIEFRKFLREFEGLSVPLPENSFKSSGTNVSTRLIFLEKK